ncbi:DUF4332 domain-containing protein [bacterium]|nr:DUF4332 domain-containing protein [bacterium]MBU1073128.1 DUF4332 domain-containing protein [bacterium]MBU1675695.1 DUF4332 domain-containing protein [bacterium]
MAYKIERIEGIGPAHAGRLAAAGIATTEDLLDLCADPVGRADVAEASGLGLDRILAWANLADLMRINGIGPQFAELLEAAGVDTVMELRTRDAETLAAALEAINAARKLTRVTPTAATVRKWVDLARATEPLVRH